MPAHGDAGALGAGDHHGGVPPQVGTETTFHGFIAREVRFVVHPDRVDVRGGHGLGNRHVLLAGTLEHVQQDVACAGATAFSDEAVE